MADRNAKFPNNLPGPYYVDQQCIACDACVMEAPNFFVMEDVEGHAYVAKQPQEPHEVEMCESALEACPVDAIGRDGEET